MKRILKKCNNPYSSLLEYLNTPLTGMLYSPCQLLMSRPTRTLLPATKDFLAPKLTEDVVIQTKQNKEKQKIYYNRNAKNLPDIQSNTNVRFFKDKKWEQGILLKKTEHPRSYLIDTPNGTIRRNRRHINLTKEDISVRHNNDNEFVELNNNSDNQITNGRNITSNENVEQIAEPSNTAIKPSSVVEHNDSEPSTTLRRSNRIKIDLTI